MTYHQLTQEERYLIAAQRRCGYSPAEMARVLGRHRSTVVCELRPTTTATTAPRKRIATPSPVVGAVVAEPF